MQPSVSKVINGKSIGLTNDRETLLARLEEAKKEREELDKSWTYSEKYIRAKFKKLEILDRRISRLKDLIGF
jgi:hypothetical protein